MDYTTLTQTILNVVYLLGFIFGIYLYFKNPQVRTEQATIKLRDDLTDLQKQITEVKENHIHIIENDVKALTQAVNDLSKTVIKLSTIIDERIPKGK